MKKQTGFTLIELVVVIVILGILAATALPKFIDLSTDAGQAAASGVAGGISSGSAVNYSGKALNKGVTPGSLSGTVGTVCTVGNMGSLLTSGWPAGFGVGPAAGSNASCVSGGSVTCSVSRTDNAALSAVAGVTCY